MSGNDRVTSPLTSGAMLGPASRARKHWLSSEWADLRRLKVISVVLPIIFLVVLEIGLFSMVPRKNLLNGYHFILILITILSITAFGLVMFHFINRAQQQVLKQNRELTAMNAVSNAVQDKIGVDRIIEAVLENVMAWSEATEVSVTVFTPQETPLDANGGTEYRRIAATLSGADDLLTAAIDIVEIPLYTGTRVVGQMRLRRAYGASEGSGLALGTLQNIGHQLAYEIQLAQLVADLERRNQESEAFRDILLQISDQGSPAEILASIVRHARQLVSSDEAIICLNEAVFRAGSLAGTDFNFDGQGAAIISSASDLPINCCDLDENHLSCSSRSSSEWQVTLAIPIRGRDGILGEFWIARRSDLPFTAYDQNYLEALSGLAAIALTSAQARESERQGTILAERERIAREMHDSLAQVLGVIHLRLRALDSHPENEGVREIKVEVAELADICAEAYNDVREAILGLRESSKTERGLLDSLRAYLVKFSDQCGIQTSLASDLDHELALSPRCEVQMIRVIQEALTNVRKHSGAKSAIVRITESSAATTFVVEDDGHGFDQDGSHFNHDGFGLFTMRERMGLLNGSLTIDSALGRGTRVIASVPERSRPKPIPIEVKNASK